MDSEEVKPGFGSKLSKETYLDRTIEWPPIGSSGYKELEEHLIVIMKELFCIFCTKQKDYGPGNINAFGEFGILVRTNDKIERLKNLYKKHGGWSLVNKRELAPANESIDETWIDTAIYPMIALLVRRGQWPK